MKTNKFENTIRQKLESISPDFHEDNWAQMQSYMQVHNPPGFWQQYGSWLGYAAAASVTTVMAFLYINQLSQTKELKQDLAELRNEIRMISSTSIAPKTDTVYIVQKDIVREPILSYPKKYASEKLADISHPDEVTNRAVYANSENTSYNKKTVSVSNQDEHSIETYANQVPKQKTELAQNTETSSLSVASGNRIINSGSNSQEPYSSKALDENFSHITELSPVTPENGSYRAMKYAMANRMSPKQTRKVWLATTTPVSKATAPDHKKVEKTAKADHIIPQLNIKAPYRFGAGFQFEGNNQVKTIVGEVLVSKKFSIATGLSWLKIKPMNFRSEKIFKEKNKGDFKEIHPGEVPMAFQVKNISVNPTLLQIPLTLAYRNEVAKDFSYFVGAGTNVTLNGKEKITYDCWLPITGKEFNNQSLERKMDIPLFNSMNVTAGIEKSWHPIVVQIEGYVYSYFKPLNPTTQRTGPGVKMKLLYQIGKKM